MEKKLYKVFEKLRQMHGFSEFARDDKLYIDYICGIGRAVWLIIFELPDEDEFESELYETLDLESDCKGKYDHVEGVYSDYSAYSLYKRILKSVAHAYGR